VETRIDLQRCVLQNLRGHETAGGDRRNLIVVAMHHQDSRIPSEIFAPGRLSIKRQSDVPVELRPVGYERFPEGVERRHRQACRIFSVFNISGGTELMSTALETRLAP
jgi:hypothetical protein